ncbi:MAG TPA: hypothetical protein VLI92_02030 [Candidatus Saccharimonadales bacterium]|nr:hypothetical protein [Candidatus Saccharimonadales bacterium]
MATENVTLDKAVADAVTQENTTQTEQTTETVDKGKETSTEVKTSETTQQPSAEEVARTEKLDKAIRLYEALEDPNVGPSVLRTLAEKAGLLGLNADKTPKQITKSVVDTLKESLGAEYEFLADRLADGIDTIVKQIVTEQLKPVQAQTQEAVERAVKADVDSAFAKFESTHKDFKEHEVAMTELSKKLPYTGDYPMEEYLDNLYKIVTTDKKEAKVIQKTVDKINKNAQELRDSSTEVQETRITKGSKLPSLNEAVAAAMRNERFV